MKKMVDTRKRKKRFEYDVTLVDARSLRQLVYFCSPTGECSSEEVPHEQPQEMKQLLNSRGLEGWELVQAVFSRQGMLNIWKREV